MSDTKKRKRNGRDDGGWSSDDSEAAEERSEHHYMLRVGDEFDHGRYTVVQQLGKGTFGRVVEMWDRTEKLAVAVKIVRAVEKCVADVMVARTLLNDSAVLVLLEESPVRTRLYAACWTVDYYLPHPPTHPQVRSRGRDRERDTPLIAAHTALARHLSDRSAASNVRVERALLPGLR